MEGSWTLVMIVWSVLIGMMLICLIPVLRETPEQRKAGGEMARKELKKHWENEKEKLRRAPQEIRESMDAEGTVRLFLLIPWVLLAVIVSILLLVAAIC